MVLVDLALPVGPGNIFNSHNWVSWFRMLTRRQLFQLFFSDKEQHKLNNRVLFVWLLTPNTGSYKDRIKTGVGGINTATRYKAIWL